jgi:pimeloyl-ACP methyl ester carboxylesterase
MLALIAVVLGGSAALLASALWLFQERLIYLAPRYLDAELRQLPSGLVALRDPRQPDSIVAFYRPPAAGGELRRLWLAFGGNGDLALRWEPALSPAATGGTAVLLVEYPGYGAHRGSPSPEALLAGTEKALELLAQHLGLRAPELRARVSVLGFSLGSAAALKYAAVHPVQRIVLVAPFTSMLDMARRTVGGPLSHLLRHRYDNVESLRRIRARGAPPLSILHGEADSLIPHEMGKALADLVPGSHFELVPGAGHQDVVALAHSRLLELLAE